MQTPGPLGLQRRYAGEPHRLQPGAPASPAAPRPPRSPPYGPGPERPPNAGPPMAPRRPMTAAHPDRRSDPRYRQPCLLTCHRQAHLPSVSSHKRVGASRTTRRPRRRLAATSLIPARCLWTPSPRTGRKWLRSRPMTTVASTAAAHYSVRCGMGHCLVVRKLKERFDWF